MDALGGALLDGFLARMRLGFEQTLVGSSSTCEILVGVHNLECLTIDNMTYIFFFVKLYQFARM